MELQDAFSFLFIYLFYFICFDSFKLLFVYLFISFIYLFIALLKDCFTNLRI